MKDLPRWLRIIFIASAVLLGVLLINLFNLATLDAAPADQPVDELFTANIEAILFVIFANVAAFILYVRFGKTR